MYILSGLHTNDRYHRLLYPNFDAKLVPQAQSSISVSPFFSAQALPLCAFKHAYLCFVQPLFLFRFGQTELVSVSSSNPIAFVSFFLVHCTWMCMLLLLEYAPCTFLFPCPRYWCQFTATLKTMRTLTSMSGLCVVCRICDHNDVFVCVSKWVFFCQCTGSRKKQVIYYIVIFGVLIRGWLQLKRCTGKIWIGIPRSFVLIIWNFSPKLQCIMEWWQRLWQHLK